MVIEHHSRRPLRLRGPDILEAATAISEKVMLAAFDASKQLESLGIPHAIIGGIAVGAHGAPRATRDVDFLVSEADAFSVGHILSFREGVPIAVGGVRIDYLTPEGDPHVDLLREALINAPMSEGMPGDVEVYVRKYITDHAPELLERLDLAIGG